MEHEGNMYLNLNFLKGSKKPITNRMPLARSPSVAQGQAPKPMYITSNRRPKCQGEAGDARWRTLLLPGTASCAELHGHPRATPAESPLRYREQVPPAWRLKHVLQIAAAEVQPQIHFCCW